MERKIDQKCLLYRQMIQEAKTCQKFKSLNERDILDFPLHVPMGTDVISFLKDTFDKYCLLLEHMQKIRDIEYDNLDVKSVRALGDIIIEVLQKFRNGKIADAYYAFEKYANEIYDKFPIWKMKEGEFYRMRKERDINRVSKMYPLPPELRYLSGGMRFSIPVYSCFYVGQSMAVCKLEISDTGSMINVKPKAEFDLLDLTFSDDMKNGGAEELKFIHTWPLIASCYIDQFFCLQDKCVYPPEGLKFNEKYVIPQFLTTYLRKCHEEIKGIRYYTVKDLNLNPFGEGEKNMRNIVIYVDSSSNHSYDEFISKFEWSKPYNV